MVTRMVTPRMVHTPARGWTQVARGHMVPVGARGGAGRVWGAKMVEGKKGVGPYSGTHFIAVPWGV